MRCLWLFFPVMLSGCLAATSPEFRLNTEGRRSASIRPEQADAIVELLADWFGTPDHPKRPPGVDLRTDQLQAAAGPIAGDAEGNQRGLFRRHCASCHGISGDGVGPLAAVLYPYPRDFRNGVFKFTSTAGGAKPARDDLLRTLRQGVPGTAMPSFQKLPNVEIDALLEYVRYLSIRGETELFLLQTIIDEDAPLPLDRDEVIDACVLPTARTWTEAESLRIESPPPSGDRTHGRRLFLDPKVQCAACHGVGGNGRGERSPLYDDWNLRKKDAAAPASFRLPIVELHARDFTSESFRGGDRPIDQYWRVAVGIQGTPMPAFGPAPGVESVLQPDEIWDVVQYVRSLHALQP